MAPATLLNSLSPLAQTPAIIIPTKPCPIILSHKQLCHRILGFRDKLAAVGITRKDAVAIVLPNSLEFAVAFLAIAAQRAVCAPLNPGYRQGEFEFYLDELRATLVLVPRGAIAENGEIVKAARKCNSALAEVYFNGTEVLLELEAPGQANEHKRAELQQSEPGDIALIFHTSGTTGRPKAVPLTHRNLCQTMVNIRSTYELTPADRTLLVMPLFHVHGLLAGFLTPLMSGGSCIIPAKFSATEFWTDFVQHEANWYTAVPTIHQILLKNPLPSPMPSIRFIRSCSSPLSPITHKQLETLFGAPVLEAYAMTEAAHQMTSNPLPPAVRKPGSVGIPQGLAVRIMDEEGNSLPRGQGEVCVLGPNVTSGYLGDPNLIASPFTTSGFLRTGDQGYLDEDGYLFLTGRIKELINKGGEKISPVEIDNLLSQHPSVAEAVSFAIEDELYGQNVAAAIVLREGATTSKEDISTWFGTRAVKFKIPKIFFTATMPKTATGKVQRSQIARAMIENEKKHICF